MLTSREDLAQSEGVNASLDVGKATEMARQARALGTSGPQQPSGTDSMQAPPGAPDMQPQGGPQPTPPAEPRQPMTREGAKGVFSDPPTGNIPWRQGIELLNAHPATGKVMAMLARRAREGR